LVSFFKDEANSYSRANGLFFGDNIVPMTLFPSHVEKCHYNLAFRAETIFHKLVDRISRNPHFLIESLKHCNDPFTLKVMNVMTEAQEAGIVQPISLGIFRNDYMIDNMSNKLCQVEINTISSGMGCLGPLITNWHHYLIERFNPEGFKIDQHPENKAHINIPKGMARAHKLYGNEKAVILFVVQKIERNITDQRNIEYELFRTYNIRCIRRTLSQIAQNATLDNDSVLRIDGLEISICYFRAGYTPNDYYGDDEWNARLLMEKSKSIKCPTAAYQLVQRRCNKSFLKQVFYKIF
jgi:glutathione synthase